jgi:hypothetical protein
MSTRAVFSEHDSEPVHGLPGVLPAGEHVVWQGAPEWRSHALNAYHVRSLTLYFSLMVLARGGYLLVDGASLLDALTGMVGPAVFAAIALAIMAGIAILSARSTVTSKRVVIRQGIALESTINLPFAVIESAALKLRRDGSGDLALTMQKPHRVSYVWLWPHVRPWHLLQPQPSLRSLADAETAADRLSRAFKAAVPEARRAGSTVDGSAELAT